MPRRLLFAAILQMFRGFRTMARGRDHIRYLQTGVVATDTAIKQKRGNVSRFLRGWNRALKFYQDDPEVMIPYIQRKLAVSDAKMARRMYEDDHGSASLTGVLNADAAREILDTAREALRIKETVALDRVFDFSLAQEAMI
ncbi:MAG: hypothetical protein ACREPG_00720 [Candidatus Binatia bacterium]